MKKGLAPRGDETQTAQKMDSPHVMRHRQGGSPVQQDLDYLVVVPVGGQDEGCDVGGEGGGVGG